MSSRPRLMGLTDAAKLLGIAPNTFLVAIERHKIYHQVVGQRKIFFYKDVLEYKKQREIQAKSDKRVKLKS